MNLNTDIIIKVGIAAAVVVIMYYLFVSQKDCYAEPMPDEDAEVDDVYSDDEDDVTEDEDDEVEAYDEDAEDGLDEDKEEDEDAEVDEEDDILEEDEEDREDFTLSEMPKRREDTIVYTPVGYQTAQ